METRIGPIQPNRYRWEGDKKVNYFRGDKQHSCEIINGDQHLIVPQGFYTYKFLADLDPTDATGKGRRDYIKETLDAVDWENLDKYPDSALGVNLKDLITARTGFTDCYHTKLHRVKMAASKLIWGGDDSQGATLNGLTEEGSSRAIPTEIVGGDGEVLATFDHETMRKRGFWLADWWMPNRRQGPDEIHVVIAHSSKLAASE